MLKCIANEKMEVPLLGKITVSQITPSQGQLQYSQGEENDGGNISFL